jgi:hypothetical protein
MLSKLGNGEYCIIDGSYLNKDLIKNKKKVSKNITAATYNYYSILIGTIENSCGYDIYNTSTNDEFHLSYEIAIIPEKLLNYNDEMYTYAHSHYFSESVSLKEKRGRFTIMNGNKIYMEINTKRKE